MDDLTQISLYRKCVFHGHFLRAPVVSVGKIVGREGAAEVTTVSKLDRKVSEY